MIKSILILLLGSLHFSFQEVTVVSYSSGKVNTPGYENFSFWTKDGKRAYIQYSYGKDSKDVLAKYLGADTLSGQHAFKIQVPGKPLLYVIPEGYKLKVTDKSGKYLRHFTWEREEPGASSNPADTSTPPCEICVKDETEAIQLIQKKFLQ
ncbi:MAG: hypothetical protein P4L51_27570 [Puia sp.]|nr:hypothetical protein [Puia sp.]